MHIVHIAAELAPVAKVGGLGDVIYGLSRETNRQRHKVTVMLPKYDSLELSEVEDLQLFIKSLPCAFGKTISTSSVWSGKVGGISVYFIDAHHPKRYFSRGCIYGCADDAARFLYFSRAALEFIFSQKKLPKVIHIHDWHTAAVAPLYRDIYEFHGAKNNPKIVLTIHNLEYQGRCSLDDINGVGLESSRHFNVKSMKDSLYPNTINLLQGGIIHSDFITTVSPTYAEEIKTPSFGYGLDPLLVKMQHKFAGILNGIDYNYWNPATDPYLPNHFNSKETPVSKKNPLTFDRKGFLKKKLRQRLNMDVADRPIVASVCRLVPQKGVELIKYAAEHVADKGGQFVLLGTTTIPTINDEFQALKRKYTDHPHIHIILNHQEELAHMIFAGADILIIPSLFEPCGLTQMIALRYGTLPIVRRTGGLRDTIFDVDTSGKAFKDTNGYTFDLPTSKSFDETLTRAISCWLKDPDKWHQLVLNGMNIDFSWKKSTKQYLEVYKKIIKL